MGYYNLKRMKQIPFQQVAELLGLKYSDNENISCFNKDGHRNRDQHPSFRYYPDEEEPHFHCFGEKCGLHGDVINLVQYVKKMAFTDACEFLYRHFPDEDIITEIPIDLLNPDSQGDNEFINAWQSNKNTG